MSTCGSRDNGGGLQCSTMAVIGGGDDLQDLTGVWRLRMLKIEKSVDDTLQADFIGSASFSDGCISNDGGIASEATLAGGEWDADRSSSTDDGDVGEVINFLVAVVDVAGSSSESHIVACIVNEHACQLFPTK